MKFRIKNNVKDIPFHLLQEERIRIAKENPENIEKAWQVYLRMPNNWLTNYGIKDFSTWLYPQLMAMLAEMKLNTNADGLINGRDMWIDNIDTNSAWWKGVVTFIKIDPRGLTVSDKQYTSPGRAYCSLVPIVMAAHKLYNDVPYSRWSRSSLGAVVNKSLLDAMLWTPDLENFYSDEELLEIRDKGLEIMSGNRSGQLNKAESTFKLSGIEDPYFRSIPHLAQVMLTQIWCAHPDNRTNLMILDPVNWDNAPQPLLKNLFNNKPVKEVVSKVSPENEVVIPDPWD